MRIEGTKKEKDDLIMRSCFVGVCLIVGILYIIPSPTFVFILIPISFLLVAIPFIRLARRRLIL